MHCDRRCVLPLLCAAFHSIALGQSGPLLGVLEDTPGVCAGEPHYRSVRAVFYRDGGEWKAFPSDCRNEDCLRLVASQYPKNVIWTVGFDGRALGQLTTQAPGDFKFYSHIGQLNIVGTSPIPTVGKPSAAFEGWLSEPVYRPLLANSHPYFSDPDGWKPSPVPDGVLLRIRREFRRKYPKFEDCQVEGKAMRYTDTGVRLIKSYLSGPGWRLVQVGVNGCLTEGGRGDPVDEEWFVATPRGEVSYLDGNMWLVDAADLDHDGSSEVVFSIDDYNRGGYKLFYADFKKSAEFKFSYH
jgi:hypothetical protein